MLTIAVPHRKIAVYAITKNEEHFIDRWYESCKDADYIHITDTGSFDGTVEKARALGINVNSIKLDPWRFDDARNFSLLSLPEDIDICVCLDLDEVLLDGWYDLVKKELTSEYDRLRYNYVWNWVNGKPGVTYLADKIHKRHGFRWVNPVHEVLKKDIRLGPEKQKFIKDTLIHHYADEEKSRSSYLPLLQLSTQEDPYNDRNAHYYARELMFNRQWQEAIKEFQRHLNLPTSKWDAERAASYRFMGDCYWALGNVENAIECFENSVKEAPHLREGYVSLAQAYRITNNYENVVKYCKKALSIKEKDGSYIHQPYAWSDWPEQMLKEAEQYVGH